MQVRAVGEGCPDSRRGADGLNGPHSTTFLIIHVLHHLEQTWLEPHPQVSLVEGNWVSSAQLCNGHTFTYTTLYRILRAASHGSRTRESIRLLVVDKNIYIMKEA
jgi:hypothetical protein